MQRRMLPAGPAWSELNGSPDGYGVLPVAQPVCRGGSRRKSDCAAHPVPLPPPPLRQAGCLDSRGGLDQRLPQARLASAGQLRPELAAEPAAVRDDLGGVALGQGEGGGYTDHA